MKKSLRSAIDAKCKECIYDSVCPGTWRQQVMLCSVEQCPIWPHRPKTQSSIPLSVLNYYGAESPHSEIDRPSLKSGERQCA